MENTTQATLKLSIFYYLSAAGQKAALKQGIAATQRQRVDGEITAAQLDELEPVGFGIAADGKLSLNGIIESADHRHSDKLNGTEQDIVAKGLSVSFEQLYYDQPQPFEALLADYARLEASRRAIRKRIESARESVRATERAAKTARQTEAIAAFFANPAARASDSTWRITLAGGLAIEQNDRHPQFNELVEEVRRRNLADAERKAEDERLREEGKQRQIENWIKEHGTESQQERLAAGLLPRDEAVQLIKDAAFAPLDQEFARYDRLEARDVKATCDDDCGCAYGGCSISYETDDLSEASAAEWEQMKQMRAVLPGATVVLRLHTGVCADSSCAGGRIERKGMYVKVEVGAFTFNREYAVAEQSE